GAFMAEEGKKVLLIDFDPQGNMSSSVGTDKEKPGIYEVIIGKLPLKDAIQETTVRNLNIVSSNVNLAGANIELIEVDRREFFLKNAVMQVIDNWDYVLIDCPPSLGLLTLNGLTAAQQVYIPMQCEYFALEGLSMLLKTVQQVQKGTNPNLKLGGIIFTMYDSRTRLANEVVQEVTGYFKEKVFKTVIPRNVRLSEAPSHSVPINQYDMTCIGAKSYKKLAREVLDRV
ncbi:MAG: ParA family protein, partial [Spirochaetales bacterium]|nr:ParA family protein [Spirochaetales bacterium]